MWEYTLKFYLCQWLHLGEFVLPGQAVLKHSNLYFDFMVETGFSLTLTHFCLNRGNLQENLELKTLSTLMSQNGLIAYVVCDGL